MFCFPLKVWRKKSLVDAMLSMRRLSAEREAMLPAMAVGEVVFSREQPECSSITGFDNRSTELQKETMKLPSCACGKSRFSL